jgi:hypothetical protein
MYQSWREPSAAWWAKVARANKHIQDIRAVADEFESSRPYEVRQEDTDDPDEIAFRFHILQPVPPELLTAVGDSLHNMRSCLDSIAYELARQYLHGAMTDKQKSATQFPICETGEAFDEFFQGHGVRRDMYGDQEKKALRCVQPFALREEAKDHGVELQNDPHLEFITDELHRLHTLSVVDKHRRLPFLVWYLDFMYWDNPDWAWRYAQPPHAEFRDQSLVGYLKCRAEESLPPHATFDFKLSLIDDPGYRQDLMGVLTRWHYYLTNWVIPRIFIVAEGNPPPIMIMGS